MIVRIRCKHGPLIVRPAASVEAPAEIEPALRPAMAPGVAALLSPVAFLACALAFWRLGADMGLASQFVIRDGVFSHWQVWFTVAGLLQLTAYLLERRPKGGDSDGATG